MKVGVVGLGKLGAPLVGFFASKGHQVCAVDTNPRTVKALRYRECPVDEPGLSDLLGDCWDRIQASTDYRQVRDADLTFIIVPTPTDETGEFSNTYVLAAIRDVCKVVAGKKGHIIVAVSTVKLGSMREFARIIEAETGMRVGEDVGLLYNPEFVALGDVVRGMARPDAILIGEPESDEWSGNVLEAFYHETCENNPPVHRMSWENAEVAKLALNVSVTAKISLANTFAEVCQRIPGGDVDKVTAFLGQDSRIGGKYLKGGLGFSGPCFPRDGRAFTKMAERVHARPNIVAAIDGFNRAHNTFAVGTAIKVLPKGAEKVALLGVTYKPGTAVTDETPALCFVNGLRAVGMKVSAYDPMGRLAEITVWNLRECLNGASLAVLVTPWPQFKQIEKADVDVMQDKVVLDCWRFLDRALLESWGVEYHALGVADK